MWKSLFRHKNGRIVQISIGNTTQTVRERPSDLKLKIYANNDMKRKYIYHTISHWGGNWPPHYYYYYNSSKMGAQIGTMSRLCYFWNRHRCKRRVYVSRSTVRGHCCNEECSLLIFIVVDRSTMPCKQYTVRFAHTGISTNTKIPHDRHDLQIHGKLSMDCEPSCHSRFLVHGAAHDVRRKIKTL